MKKTDEIFKREYEERFNWYILKVISKTYKNYLRNKQNKYAKEVYEINMDLLVGDNDVIFEENTSIWKIFPMYKVLVDYRRTITLH